MILSEGGIIGLSDLGFQGLSDSMVSFYPKRSKKRGNDKLTMQ